MGDEIGKESNYCQGVMNAGLRAFDFLPQANWRLGGKGLRQGCSVVRAHHCHSLAP